MTTHHSTEHPDESEHASAAEQGNSSSFEHQTEVPHILLGQDQLFRAVWEHAADAMVLSDAQGIVLAANPAYHQLYGYPPEAVIGRSFSIIFAPEVRASAIEQYHAIFHTPEPKLMYESTIQRADGTQRIVESRIDFLSHQGQRTAMLSIIRDITARKQAEVVLREQAETVETINRIGQLLSAELDLQQLVQAVTDAATELTNASFGAFFYNVTDDHGEHYTLYTLSGMPREAFANFPMPRATHIFGPTFRGESVIRIADVRQDPRYGQMAPHFGMPRGHVPVASYLAVPVISRTGEVIGGLFFGHPEPGVFTQRAEQIVTGLAAQTAIAMDNARLFHQAQTAVRLRDQFLSIASHELKTPLTSLLGYTQLLERRTAQAAAISERERQPIRMIIAQAKRLDAMINALLDVSRIDQGQLRIDRVRLDVVELIRRVVADVQATLDHHTITAELPNEPIVIEGDAMRLEQVVHNLLSNSIKYSPQHQTVTITLTQHNHQVCIRVVDHGIGIPAAAQPRLFDRFYRADNVDPHHISGIGIGLYVVKEIISQHGGTIEVVSQEGFGSTFKVYLPLPDQQ